MSPGLTLAGPLIGSGPSCLLFTVSLAPATQLAGLQGLRNDSGVRQSFSDFGLTLCTQCVFSVGNGHLRKREES